MKITVTQGNVELDSPEEALFYGLCRLWEIPVERTRLDSFNSVQTNDYWYCPGFRLDLPSGTRFWAEVSDGQYKHEAAFRPMREAFRSSGRRLAVLYREELHVLMTRANGYAVSEQLKIWAR